MVHSNPISTFNQHPTYNLRLIIADWQPSIWDQELAASYHVFNFKS